MTMQESALLLRLLSFKRTILMVLAFILMAGLYAYITVPKESRPDVKIPLIYVAASQRGISPEDAETLLVKPLEQQLRGIDGVKEMRGAAFEGGGNVQLEFDAGFDQKKALDDVRARVDVAKADFPADADEPQVIEISFSQFPVLLVALSGPLPKRALFKIADRLKQEIETIPSILSVTIQGNQAEVLEVLLKPSLVSRYKLLQPGFLSKLSAPNTITPAGEVRTKTADHPVKMTGTFKTFRDVANLPLLTDEMGGQKVSDVAQVRRTFVDPDSLARDQGRDAVILKVAKRSGENILDTVAKVRALVAHEQQHWPSNLSVTFSADESHRIWDMIHDLQNEITSAVLLVMLVIVFSLGLRSALLVGVAIPGSFLMGVFFLYIQGLTLNIVVLFSLILSIGMLVDGAIIVVEYADRRMTEGAGRALAFPQAAQRMFWPVVSSLVTIIVAFLPLLFWPGIVGQFMRYLPITLIATLVSSILMALVFVPTLGTYFAKAPKDLKLSPAPGRFEKKYVEILEGALNHPWRVIFGSGGLLVVVLVLFSFYGKGIEFFPNVEPDSGYLVVKAPGNLSLEAKDQLVRRVEKKLLDCPHLAVVSTTTGAQKEGGDQDIIGRIFIEFKPWQERPKVDQIMADLHATMKDIPGVKIEDALNKSGPAGSKPIQIEFSGGVGGHLDAEIDAFKKFLESQKGVRQVEDDRSPPGIEWRLEVDKFRASQMQVSWAQIGDAIQLLTNGIKIGEYRPSDSTESVDIIVRYPSEDRSLGNFETLLVPTSIGNVPLSNFVEKRYGKRTSILRRVDGRRAYTVTADVDAGELVQPKVQAAKGFLASKTMPGVKAKIKGEEEDQNQTQDFLKKAFGTTLFLIALILVTQFNSFYSMMLILSSVVMSTIGVFVGLMIRGMPFGIVMGGIGVIALSGIIVSNNIILIDTYDRFMEEGMKVRDAIIKACSLRLRPVILTKLTTVLGLTPIMLGISLDYGNFDIQIGAPSTQWWTMLSTAIVFGVLFASPLTLIFTPCALLVKGQIYRFFKRGGPAASG